MAIQSWQDIIDSIRNGEPVTAEVTNRAIFQIAQRTEHLKAKQDAQDYAQAIFVSDAPLRDDVLSGHAVYFDVASGKFAPAYAEMVYRDGYLTLSETSAVVGIVVQKDTTNSGVIVVEGLIDPTNYTGDDCFGDDITVNLLANVNDRGLLYLASGSLNAGKLIPKPGILNVPVGHLFDNDHLLVRPPISSPLETQALRFNLAARPAGPELVIRRVNGLNEEVFPGTPPAVGTRVRLVTVNTNNLDGPVVQTYLTATVHKTSNTSVGIIQLIDVELTKHCVELLGNTSSIGSYEDVLKAPAGQDLVIKPMDSLTGTRINANLSSLSSYVSPVDNSSLSEGHALHTTYIDPTLPGWLPATQTYFPGVAIPDGAKYGYNFNADPVLSQLFPEAVVGTYVVFKDGQALPNGVVVTGSNGIWWKDSFNQLPWHKVGSYPNETHVLPDTNIRYSDWNLEDSENIILPTDLALVYTKLVSGGIRVVTSLEADETSPIVITDPEGNPAITGPLKISASLAVTNSTNTESGALVVKNITGFDMRRGLVVEQLLAGSNIALSSTSPNGQGTVTVSVTGLDGKLEGQPDILAIDDILIEKDTSLNIFYSVMPLARNSSILGKVDVPSFLEGSYRLNLIATFVALHSSGDLTPPALPLTWNYMLPALDGAKKNLALAADVASGSVSGGFIPYSAGTVEPRDFFTTSVSLNVVSAGGTVFFKLARNAVASDGYGGRLGIVSLKYKFVKI